ncbi:MAG: ABC transporter ATP-binding protein [Desulfobacteraceae bacterium]|nr:ABC transporter ATP-binding protein [Desulfobacteraceae bacterium]
MLTVLKDISFIAEDGDFVVVVGESGCGKSTLLNLIAGLLPLTSGDILADNQKITGTHPSRSILFQQPSLLPWLNTMENIVFGCKLRGELNNLEERSEQLIEIMGLSGFENHYPHELSVGMAQRACLARALMGHPKILLLDEPFGALDSMNRTRLQEELIEFWAVENFTVIFVTHDIDEAIVLGNKICGFGRPSGTYH